jgi:hypothetical protein
MHEDEHAVPVWSEKVTLGNAFTGAGERGRTFYDDAGWLGLAATS